MEENTKGYKKEYKEKHMEKITDGHIVKYIRRIKKSHKKDYKRRNRDRYI